jgi:sec-independent protein translocase protein TatB
MFDIGFTEMMIIAVVALVVIGPERLPKVARQAGEWMGKLRRYVDDVKSDINRQMQLDELRKIQADVKDAAQSLKNSVDSVVSEASSELTSLNAAFEGAASTTTDEPRTDWDRIYAARRLRERIKDRRIERSKELGLKRPKRAYLRFTRPQAEVPTDVAAQATVAQDTLAQDTVAQATVAQDTLAQVSSAQASVEVAQPKLFEAMANEASRYESAPTIDSKPPASTQPVSAAPVSAPPVSAPPVSAPLAPTPLA